MFLETGFFTLHEEWVLYRSSAFLVNSTYTMLHIVMPGQAMVQLESIREVFSAFIDGKKGGYFVLIISGLN